MPLDSDWVAQREREQREALRVKASGSEPGNDALANVVLGVLGTPIDRALKAVMLRGEPGVIYSVQEEGAAGGVIKRYGREAERMVREGKDAPERMPAGPAAMRSEWITFMRRRR